MNNFYQCVIYTKMKELFIDIETSGTDPVKHSILSIGITVSFNGLEDFQSFYREITYDELIVMPNSIKVNKIDLSNQSGKISVKKADEEAASFIKKHYHDELKPMPVGLSVGSFDMQFIKRQMPNLSNKLNVRSVDLNSLIYLYAEKHSINFTEAKESLSNTAIIKTNSLGLGVEKHNALYDAVYSLALYLEIKEVF